MELIYDIATALGVANEFVTIDRVSDNLAFIRVVEGKGVATHWTCKTIRSGKRMAKNSLRTDW
jgi:hypothetical protein